MKPVPLGLANRHELVPDRSHTAAAVGNVGVEVVGTPFLVGYFEIAAHRAILPYCEAGEVTVGTRIAVDHLAAALPGSAVSAAATVVAVEGRRILFEVEVASGRAPADEGPTWPRHRAARHAHGARGGGLSYRGGTAMAIDGTWKIAMETPLGTRQASLTLDASGGGLTGTMAGDQGATAIYDGSVSGNQLAFKVDIVEPMPMTLDFSATVEGDTLSGSVKLGMFGSAPLTGTRG
jgi:predicted thioesterase